MKQVIVVDNSLKLPKGKLASQVAHASVASFLECRNEIQTSWVNSGMPKIVLKAQSCDELEFLFEAARRKQLPTAKVVDEGKTVLKTGTLTCIGIGPALTEEFADLTSNFKLL